MKKRAAQIPTTVLEHARLAVATGSPRKPVAPAPARAPKREKPASGPKAKVIAALKKLHPMD
ncbi:MAG: hypothetical protein U0228_17490 [Myxococcaceae bacterium]